jgi:ribonuclease D
MSTSVLAPPILVGDQGGLDDLVRALAACETVGVDTESNSLHAYRERVCLIQFSTPGDDYIVDPIGSLDVRPLAPFFANPDQQKVFHAAEYDILCLRRDFGFEFENIFDTMSAARTLGWPRVGLSAILDTHFNVKVGSTYQRSDWGRRPLSPEQLDYARLDTHYLIALRDRQREILIESDCWQEAQEEFARLARVQGDADAVRPDPAAFWRVKGARDLSPERAAVLQALFAYREEQAERVDQPPFKIVGEPVLLELARRAPINAEALRRVPGMSPAHVHRHGRGVLRAIEEGLRAPAVHPPPIDREPDEVRDRYDRLRTWRKNRARARGVESDVILPRTALQDLARRPPRTRAELARITDIGPWRRAEYGEELLALLSVDAPAPESPSRR